jgi:ribosomal protein S18 acetylase RimI-like enzyme
LPPFRIDVVDTLVPDEVAAIEERLYRFNVAATGISDGRELGIFVRDEAGTLMGALIGTTWGGCCEIRILWVSQAERRRGLGRALMTRAEGEARARGCVQVVLHTHTFQAPDFYRRLGYHVIGEIPNYPRGHSNLALSKPLEPAEET